MHNSFLYISFGSGDHTVKIIDWQSGKCLKVLSGHRRTPWVVRLSSVILSNANLKNLLTTIENIWRNTHLQMHFACSIAFYSLEASWLASFLYFNEMFVLVFCTVPRLFHFLLIN